MRKAARQDKLSKRRYKKTSPEGKSTRKTSSKKSNSQVARAPSPRELARLRAEEERQKKLYNQKEKERKQKRTERKKVSISSPSFNVSSTSIVVSNEITFPASFSDSR